MIYGYATFSNNYFGGVLPYWTYSCKQQHMIVLTKVLLKANFLKVIARKVLLFQTLFSEMGGGIGMGNTCKPMAVSFQCMTKFTTNKKKKRKKKNMQAKKKRNIFLCYSPDFFFFSVRILILCPPSVGAILYKTKHFQHFHIWRESSFLLRDLILFQGDILRGEWRDWKRT